ncbi:MAG: heavy-metal-associated domain-containing protein [Deltaproteobacteria bacterium]|nr:MAG: heavy-metal-associated domain-containing protein [Deltaproteobacteria bacterium]
MKQLLIAVACLALVTGCKKKDTTPKNKPTVQRKVAKANLPAPTGKPAVVLAGAALAKGTKVNDSTQCKVHMKVSGMTCEYGCAPQVRTVLKGVKGISTALVSFKTKSATVDGQGVVCGGNKTQNLINKAFAKQTYKCQVEKIEIFAGKKATKATPKKKS